MAIIENWGSAIPARRQSSGLVFEGKPAIPHRHVNEALKREHLLHLIEEELEFTYRSQNCLKQYRDR